MNKYELLYARTEKTPFNFAQIQADNDQPTTFWEWVESIDWSVIIPYLIQGGVALALDYVREHYPTFYQIYSDQLESFLGTINPEEPEIPEPPEEPAVTEENTTLMYLMLGMMLIIIIMVSQ